MQFTYYGHSCFSVVIHQKTILFDPFISNNELAAGIELSKIAADYILLSHAHADHTADCITIANNTGAKVVCNWEIHEWLHQKGIEHTHPMNIGGKWNFNEFIVKCVVAQHSSSLPDGRYGGSPMGFIISSSEGNFYYSGDTGLTLDMQLIPGWAKLNFAVLPIGDNFTMDAADAADCATMVGCRTVIGVHYNSFDFIKIDTDITRKIFENKGIHLLLLPVGGTVDMNQH